MNTTTNPEADTLNANLPTLENQARAKLENLVREQGIKPMTIEELRAMGDLWPEDESVDDFIYTVRKWRSEGSQRRLS